MAHVQDGLDLEWFICPPWFSPEIEIRPPGSRSALTAAALWKTQRKTTPPRSTSVCGVWKNWRRYLEDKPATDSHQQGGTGFLHGNSSTLFECRWKKQKINHISTNYLQGCLDIRLIVAKRNHDNDYNCDIYIKSEITLCTVTFVSLLEMNDTQSMRVGRWRESVIKSGQKEEMH